MRLTRESIDRWLSRVLPTLSPERRKVVEEYVQHLLLSGRSPRTIEDNLQAILTLGTDGKPYQELGEEDLLAWARSHPHLKPSSLFSYWNRLKTFLRWVHGCRSSRDPSPPFLSRVKVGRGQRELPRDIL
ncbi:MAG: hypothetical protein QXR87_05495, partial [Candidatus Hadarchaeales archaeon]